MNIGEIIKLNIEDINERGVGIGKTGGAVVFVPGTVKGDTASVRITACEKNYYTGECVEILVSSEYRTEPVCKVHGCGGCSLGHVSYELENEIKRNTVRNAFRRAGLDYSLVEDVVFCENRVRYRNKLTVHYSEKQRAFGLYAEGTNDVIPFFGCVICSGVMNKVVKFCNENVDLVEYAMPTSLCVRTSATGEVSVSLYCEKKCDVQKFVFGLANFVPEISGVNIIVNRKGGGYISDKIMGIDMRFSSEAFRQVNGEAFEKLLDIVHQFAEESDFSCGADLYCGSGIIGLSLAKRFPDVKFYGIEINADAVKDAKFNAAENGLENIEFFCGDSASFKKKIGGNAKPQLIVVDPPRAGLSKEMRQGLTELSPERIIYVSCNPQTLARDLASLKSSGYEIKRAVPVNMFPLTSHCECVVSLER
ncbi:MAG: 23S rRNA (uracil(1939)-C(5))-methyltransferase RlmD [Ruminococcaceae bacterium]|nr:23S rRNA (uracil(1939)-C(5))-methyltransferase RlmD [Oscillospiraceae bacterium]